MDYVLRRVTEEDREFFIKCGVKSPFGGVPGFGRYMVESVNNDAKMIFIGGQGIMEEDGTEWSEMAHYCAIVWKGQGYTVEFYQHSKCVSKSQGYETFVMTYKIKRVVFGRCISREKQEIMEMIKKCFETYGAGGCATTLCEKVQFIDTEVRWV